MIQRIQTLYLLAVSVLTALMFFFPFITAVNVNDIFIYYNHYGIKSADGILFEPVYAFAGLIFICFIVSFSSIFMFKKRILQIRLNTFNIILYIFMYIVAFGYFFLFKDDFGITNDYSLGISSLFPLINIILTYLAIRAIGADEALVKSLNRLR
jgi:hypothetical protein